MRELKAPPNTSTASRRPKLLPWVALAAVAAVALVALWGARAVLNRRVSAPAATPSLVGEAVMAPGTQPAPVFSLKDQNGQTVSPQGLRGKVVALTFLDSHCQQQCPLQGEQLGQAMTALGRKTPFTLLVVSVAPATDTVDSERAFATLHHWTDDWHWVSGTTTELAAVWKAYAIDVRPGPLGNVPHSIALFVLDRLGYERVGLLFTDPARIEHDVRLLSHS